jgi:hypothetical protein
VSPLENYAQVGAAAQPAATAAAERKGGCQAGQDHGKTFGFIGAFCVHSSRFVVGAKINFRCDSTQAPD